MQNALQLLFFCLLRFCYSIAFLDGLEKSVFRQFLLQIRVTGTGSTLWTHWQIAMCTV